MKNAEEVKGAKLTKSVLAQSENLLVVTIDILYCLVGLFFKVKLVVEFEVILKLYIFHQNPQIGPFLELQSNLALRNG